MKVKVISATVRFANADSARAAILEGHANWLRKTHWVTRFTHNLFARWRCVACQDIRMMEKVG